MNVFDTVLLLVAALLAIFAESASGFGRNLLGTQIDLLPALMVYASLTGEFVTLSLLAVWGGLCFDALSANPFGASVLPLFVVGAAIHFKRNLILREQFTAQWVLGLMASAAVPLLTLLVILSAGREPLLGWGSLWQWLVMSAAGAVLTPVVFFLFDYANGLFKYRPAGEMSFRPDREIRRGRS